MTPLFRSLQPAQKFRITVSCIAQLWLAIENDYKQYKERYDDEYHPFVYQIWTKCWNPLWKQQTSINSPVIPIHEMLDTNTFLAPPLVRGVGGVNV